MVQKYSLECPPKNCGDLGILCDCHLCLIDPDSQLIFCIFCILAFSPLNTDIEGDVGCVINRIFQKSLS